jgi:hypothetical protein
VILGRDFRLKKEGASWQESRPLGDTYPGTD